MQRARARHAIGRVIVGDLVAGALFNEVVTWRAQMGFLWCPHCKLPHGLNALRCPKTGLMIAMGVGRTERALAKRGTLIAKRYKVLALLGHESVSSLYVAKQVATGRIVLAKVVHDGDDLAPGEREAEVAEMHREAIAASTVEHPNITPVLDFVPMEDGGAVLVREHSSTAKLAHALRTAGVLTVDDAVDIISQLLSAVAALDLAGIVHRDLGTHNIYLQQRMGCRPLVKVAGLGRCSSRSLGPSKDPPSGVHYSSPELLSRGEADQRSDLFSCGVILFEMLTGRRPFEAATPDQVRASILADNPPAASQLAPQLGSIWFELLEKALRKNPAERFQTAREFRMALPAEARQASRSDWRLDGPEQVGLTETVPASDGPRSRKDANIGSKCDPYIGRLVGDRYTLETLLGSGSAGAVYKAIDTRLRRPVGLKVLHDRNRGSRQFVERFKAEALVASRLDHPNITRVLDCGEESTGRLYLVMEYLQGQSVAALLAREGRLPQGRAVDIAVQLLSSLHVAHGAHIIHRDIKPENILLLPDRDENGAPCDLAKVCDFGIAKLYEQPAELAQAEPRGDPHAEQEPEDLELTSPGVILGSPVYMAPEQIRGEPCDERTDLYAAGVTLFEMLTGRFPHEAETMTELFHKKLNEPPNRLSDFEADVDPLLEDIVMRALHSLPERRHRSAAEMRSELFEALKQFRPSPPSTEKMSIWPDAASET